MLESIILLFAAIFCWGSISQILTIIKNSLKYENITPKPLKELTTGLVLFEAKATKSDNAQIAILPCLPENTIYWQADIFRYKLYKSGVPLEKMTRKNRKKGKWFILNKDLSPSFSHLKVTDGSGSAYMLLNRPINLRTVTQEVIIGHAEMQKIYDLYPEYCKEDDGEALFESYKIRYKTIQSDQPLYISGKLYELPATTNPHLELWPLNKSLKSKNALNATLYDMAYAPFSDKDQQCIKQWETYAQKLESTNEQVPSLLKFLYTDINPEKASDLEIVQLSTFTIKTQETLDFGSILKYLVTLILSVALILALTVYDEVFYTFLDQLTK